MLFTQKKGLINILHSAENSAAFSTNGIYLRKSVMLEVNVGFKEFLFSSFLFFSVPFDVDQQLRIEFFLKKRLSLI